MRFMHFWFDPNIDGRGGYDDHFIYDLLTQDYYIFEGDITHSFINQVRKSSSIILFLKRGYSYLGIYTEEDFESTYPRAYKLMVEKERSLVR